MKETFDEQLEKLREAKLHREKIFMEMERESKQDLKIALVLIALAVLGLIIYVINQ